MSDYTETNLELFKDEFINARIGSMIEALRILTSVEFRMWIINCKIYANFHPSHFVGLEEAYIKTGKWEVPKVDLSGN